MPSPHETTETETMRQLAQDLLMALLDSIPPDKINPTRYWDHAQKALLVGCQRATGPHQLVEEMRRILQIPGALPTKIDSSVSSVISDLESRGWWGRFRQLIKKEAAMIVIYTRIRRDERRATRTPHGVKEEDFLPGPQALGLDD